MSSNAVLLRGAMQALGLTGVALAEMISSMRDDGKETAPETVSRWLNGTSPVEPALLGWLKELMRAKALESHQAVISWPLKRSVAIAVANGKGGVGTSTVAAALAVVSHKDFGIKTKHIHVGHSEDFFQGELQRIFINSTFMEPEDALAYTPDQEEVTIFDIRNVIAKELYSADEDSFLRHFKPDLLLVPADFESAFDVWGTREFIDLVSPVAEYPIRLLHRASFLSIDFSALAHKNGFNVESKEFVPFLIPRSEVDMFLPPTYSQPWVSREQHRYHTRLFEYVMDEIGAKVEPPGDREKTIQKMGFEALISFLTPRTQSRRLRKK